MKKDHIQSPIRRENSHIIHHLQPFGNTVLLKGDKTKRIKVE